MDDVEYPHDVAMAHIAQNGDLAQRRARNALAIVNVFHDLDRDLTLGVFTPRTIDRSKRSLAYMLKQFVGGGIHHWPFGRIFFRFF